jgi:hypothetical protein
MSGPPDADQLQAMLGNAGTSTSSSSRPSPPPAHMVGARRAAERGGDNIPESDRPAVSPDESAAAMDALQQRLAELRQSDSSLSDGKHPDHDKAVAEMRRLLAASETPEEREALLGRRPRLAA